MNILILMKPLSTIVPEKDTSYALMREAQRQGHNIYYLPQGGCQLTSKGAQFHVQPLHIQGSEIPIASAPILLSEHEVSIILIRTDPPFDSAYLDDMWILEQLPPHILCVNAPGGIRTVNEKIWITQFKELIPPTLISSNHAEIMAFIQTHNTVILKPTNSFGGQEIFKTQYQDPNIAVILSMLTHNETRYIIAQTYLPEAQDGDKRIILCDGEPIGAVLRKHGPNDHRNNFMAGGSAHNASLSPQEEHMCKILKPHLQKLGLLFVGIDSIGNHLIECNVTSPTCIQEINALNNTRLEETILERIISETSHPKSTSVA